VERFRANRDRFIHSAKSACRLAEDALSDDVEGKGDSAS